VLLRLESGTHAVRRAAGRAWSKKNKCQNGGGLSQSVVTEMY